ncbi:hypothetical protein B0H15DRAFT_806935 [Mycena belliarum]|uniref:Uncharacterized protein n=1 Tax=Mycena belliarum TaxID=1033014 RepID=A0AAD6TR31_9AGAR|nr:hypothetical protein B0H15DRAFT_806935 [Mycena belliae]
MHKVRLLCTLILLSALLTSFPLLPCSTNLSHLMSLPSQPVSTTTCTALSAYGARAQQCSPCCNFRAYQYERAEDAFILGDVDFNLAPETSTRGSNFEGQRLYQKSPLVSGSIATPGAAVRRYLQTFSWRRSRSRDSRYSRKGRGSPRVVHARDANPKATASPTTPPKSFLPFPSQRQSPPRVATWLSAHGTFFRLSNAALMAQYTLGHRALFKADSRSLEHLLRLQPRRLYDSAAANAIVDTFI